MKIFTITAQNFLEWYFNTGADDEQETLRTELGNKVIESLFNVGQSNITIDAIFDECETSCIPLQYLEEFDDNTEGELSEIQEEYIIKLVP